MLRRSLPALLLVTGAAASCSYPEFAFVSAPVGACDDGVLNGLESDTDCGGPACRGCSEGRPCSEGRDCVSRVCGAGVCQAPTCADGAVNGTESGRDCGGNCESKCPEGEGCIGGTDCASQVCSSAICQAPSCQDATVNGGESDRDCGGGTCGGCPNGRICNVNTDCLELLCDQATCVPAHCIDNVMNEDETDVDCGGPFCAACESGEVCTQNGDCESAVCVAGVCQMANCNDAVKNGSESDLDCGGSDCSPCANGLVCDAGGSCQSGVCQGGICQPPTCIDSVRNGTEVDVDCGLACPDNLCTDGKNCSVWADCLSAVCSTTCQAPTCSDNARNQGEGDVDCGGPCSERCATGAGCDSHDDCLTGACEAGVCATTLKVLYRCDELGPASAWIEPFFRIRNDGSAAVPLAELEFRYYYTIDGDSPQITECFFADADVACGNAMLSIGTLTTATPTADHYYSVTFSSGEVQPHSDSGKVESGFHKDPFSNYTQSNDYSWDQAKPDYTLHDKVTLYRNGILVWGTPPSE